MHNFLSHCSDEVFSKTIQCKSAQHAELYLPRLGILDCVPDSHGGRVNANDVIFIEGRNVVLRCQQILVIGVVEGSISLALVVLPWNLCSGVVNVSKVLKVLVGDGSHLFEDRFHSIK